MPSRVRMRTPTSSSISAAAYFGSVRADPVRIGAALVDTNLVPSRCSDRTSALGEGPIGTKSRQFSVSEDLRVAEPDKAVDADVLYTLEIRLPHPVVGEVVEPNGRTLPLEDRIGLFVN